MTEKTYDTRDFVKDHGITIDCKPIEQNPNMPDDDWARTASHYECILSRKNGTHDMMTYFSQGSGIKHEPTVEDVLDSLASDAQSIADYGLTDEDFEQWAGDVGYEPDSRSAERTFRLIHEGSSRLMRFLGTLLYEKLLHETERL